MDKANRTIAAEKIRSAFNVLWNRSLQIHEQRGEKDTVSYQDIVRISEALRAEGPRMMGLDGLPPQILTGLQFATAALDPNKARSKENLKAGLGGIGGAGGLALAFNCLGQFMNPGLWAIVTTFFVGGIPGGPMPIVGMAAGIAIAVGAVFIAFQKMTPNERTAKAHEFVMKGIDNWIENGSDNKPATVQEAQKYLEENITNSGLTAKDIVAAYSLMMNVANADLFFVVEERNIIRTLLESQKVTAFYNTAEAVEHVRGLGESKANMIMDWCFQVAQADDKFHESELTLLCDYCRKIDVDFDSKFEKYGLKESGI
jgi:hypothetical protein